MKSSSEGLTSYCCIVSGRVQGVFYRASVQKMAAAAGYSGYVRNLPDGNVEACVTTDKQHPLEQFLMILKTGSPYSRVDNIQTQAIDTTFKHGFLIRY